MGFSISWIGFHSLGRTETLARGGFRGTGVVESFPTGNICFAALPTGWSLLFSKDVEYASPSVLAHLSEGATVLGCQVEEHSMVSAATLCTNGQQIWHVMHDSDAGRYDLNATGTLPAQFAAIRSRLFAKQDAEPETGFMRVDYVFDIPVELAASFTGYRHDIGPAWGATRFEKITAVVGPTRR